jgi:hypothetical protein
MGFLPFSAASRLPLFATRIGFALEKVNTINEI